MTITWKNAAKNNWSAEVGMSLLKVKKAGRLFDGYINGVHVGCWNTADMAKSQTAKIFRFED